MRGLELVGTTVQSYSNDVQKVRTKEELNKLAKGIQGKEKVNGPEKECVGAMRWQ